MKGIPIEDLRKRLGGDEGYLTGPTGQEHHISLPPELPNGEDIIVLIKFTFQDPRKVGRRLSND